MPLGPMMNFLVFHEQRQGVAVQLQSQRHIITSMCEATEGCLPKGHTLWAVDGLIKSRNPASASSLFGSGL